jgi:hypothetical protein
MTLWERFSIGNRASGTPRARKAISVGIFTNIPIAGLAHPLPASSDGRPVAPACAYADTSGTPARPRQGPPPCLTRPGVLARPAPARKTPLRMSYAGPPSTSDPQRRPEIHRCANRDGGPRASSQHLTQLARRPLAQASQGGGGPVPSNSHLGFPDARLARRQWRAGKSDSDPHRPIRAADAQGILACSPAEGNTAGHAADRPEKGTPDNPDHRPAF